ncbi:hypothetical protein [Herbiconiux daphne]|uniref:Uncharacterized protein n=1 Tax=Herbiconiux daphne TaxID=2970914 RepID=A0ABT2H5L4_9MICO|nr:hypothetical protein [Herbiconiux daphne]MCS5735224.1 hypothetical protein [Herbiconiux daphne]
MTISKHDDVAVGSVRWRVAEEGLWVCTSGGSFAGTVDQSGPHYYARNHFGEYLGDYTDLSRAQSAVVSKAPGPVLRVVA